jgi:light-harvesting protein B-800-850 alpha chain
MNQGRIWCVVNPTVGLPLFLGSVALMSFTVHFAVLNNTTWMKDFYNGTPMAKASVEKNVAPVAETATTGKAKLAVEIVPEAAVTTDDSASFILTVKPKAEIPKLDLAVPG